MTIDNEISSPVAGWLWLATGFVGVTWLGVVNRRVRTEIRGFWHYFFGPEPGPEARAKMRRLQALNWGFMLSLLCFYLILDWLL